MRRLTHKKLLAWACKHCQFWLHLCRHSRDSKAHLPGSPTGSHNHTPRSRQWCCYRKNRTCALQNWSWDYFA